MYVPEGEGLADYLRDERSSGSARLIVVGNNEMTPGQRAEAASWYKRFRLERSAALGHYFTRNIRMSDGSSLRIVSNHGDDTIMITPIQITGGASKAIELGGYVILPHDAAHTNGWNKSGITDSARAYFKEGNKFTLPAKPELHVKLNAGAVDWRSTHGVVLSWDHKGNNRYHTSMWDSVFTGTNGDIASHGIYYKGTKINTDHGVSAAAVFQGYLVYVSNNDLYATPSPIGRIDDALKAGMFLKELSPSWSAVSITGSVNSSRRCSAWHFKPDGSRVACAVVDAAFGVDTWTMERMRTEAITQSKRYIDLSIVSSALAAAVSDTAFTTEAFAAYEDANLVDVDITVPAGGTLSFTGKRLWGVDYNSASTELVISCVRAGSGTSTADYTAGAELFTLDMDTYWAVLVNGVELFRADYVVPEITVTGGSPTTYVQTGGGLIKLEYLAVHSMDARYGAAVLERLSFDYAASATGCDATQSTALHLGREFAFDPFVLTPKLQVIFENTVVVEYTETVDSTFLPPLHAYLNVGDLIAFYRYGMGWKRQDDPTLVAGENYRYIPTYPQISAYYTENIYEWIFSQNHSMIGRETHTLFNNYPNQISDVLAKGFFKYEIQSLEIDFIIFWETSRLGAFNSSHIPDLQSARDNTFLALGVTTPMVQGLAIPRPNALHFIGSTNETFINQFFDQMTKLKELNAGTAQTGVTPVYRSSVFTRDTTSDPFTETDIEAAVSTAVTADGNSPDSATFQINPVRIL